MQTFKLRRRVGLTIAGFVALTAVSSVKAVFLNPNGYGQVLVYPYYTVNGGQDTLITLVNHGPAQAIKLRFLEGYNARDVLDVNLYLYGGDIWTGVVSAQGDGAGLYSPDASCTVPALPTDVAHATAFSTRSFDGRDTQGADGGPISLARTREGHIEVIAMGEVTGASLDALAPDQSIPSPGQPTPGSNGDHAGGPPNDCARLVSAWDSGGYWAANPSTNISPPLGALTGTVSIVNVERGTVQGYVADAIDAIYTPGTGLDHTAPDSLTPNIASGTSLTALTYPLYAIPRYADFERGIDAVSALFMASYLLNEFVTDVAIGADSEWVVTYPTKRFYSDPYYVDAGNPTSLFPIFNSDADAPGTACSFIGETLYDQANTQFSNFYNGLLFGALSNPNLCYSTQIVSFNQGTSSDIYDVTPTLPSKILQSALVTANFNAPFTAGRAELILAGSFLGGNQGFALKTTADQIFLGQPVTGFLATRYINNNVNGALANYTVASRHKSFVSCVAPNRLDPCQ